MGLQASSFIIFLKDKKKEQKGKKILSFVDEAIFLFFVDLIRSTKVVVSKYTSALISLF